MSTRDVYIAKMKLQLDELNVQMGKAELRAKEAREDVRDKYKEEMAKLHAQSQLAVAKLEEMQDLLLAEMRRLEDPWRLWNQPGDGLFPPPAPLSRQPKAKNVKPR